MAAIDQATRNEEAYRRLSEEVNRGNREVIDELVATNCVEHPMFHSFLRPPLGQEDPSPIEAMKAMMDFSERNWENTQQTIDQVICADDKVISVETFTGTRNGKFVTLKGMSISRFEDGKVVEVWDLFDRLGLYQQLGVVPETRELAEKAGLK
jgi:ketosteroid isomerase-like protein